MTIRRIADFYVEGFRRMTLGRTLWLVILIKLVILFAVLRVFFFQPHLETGREVEQVGGELVQRGTH